MRYHGNIVINAKWWCPINHSAVAQRTTTFNSISYNCRIESYQTMCDLPTEREYGFLLKEQFNSSHLSLPSWDDGTPHDLLTEKDVLKALASVFYGSQTTQKTPDQNLYLKYKPPTITKISSAIKPTHHNKFLVFPSSWLMFFPSSWMNGNWIGTILNPISAENLWAIWFPHFTDMWALPISPHNTFWFATWY